MTLSFKGSKPATNRNRTKIAKSKHSFCLFCCERWLVSIPWNLGSCIDDSTPLRPNLHSCGSHLLTQISSGHHSGHCEYQERIAGRRRFCTGYNQRIRHACERVNGRCCSRWPQSCCWWRCELCQHRCSSKGHGSPACRLARVGRLCKRWHWSGEGWGRLPELGLWFGSSQGRNTHHSS